MNELKIVINAAIGNAEKNISKVKKSLGGLDGQAAKSSGKISASLGKMAKVTAVAGAAIAGALAAVGAALVKIEKSTRDYRNEQAKLVTAFKSSGASAKTAQGTFKGLFRFLGESDVSVEAANHLAKLTNNTKNLSEWTKICQGIYATFGDSLPIEGLTEAANETARTGAVTGVLADALNWAGASEDVLNEQLAQCNSLSEREIVIRQTLNGLYSTAAEEFERNNKAIIKNNEAQARLDKTLASIGAAITPAVTAFKNLGATLLDFLAPAIDAIAKALAYLSDALAYCIGFITQFFNALSGKKSVSQEIEASASGVGAMAGGFKTAAKEAEKLKRATAGFDELNIMAANSSSGSSGGSGGGSVPTAPTISVPKAEGSLFDATIFDTVIKKVKEFGRTVAKVFEPSTTAFKTAFETLSKSAELAWPSIENGFKNFKNGFVTIGEYLFTNFIPEVVNGFNVNLVPMFSDIGSAAITQAGLTFETLGATFDDFSNSFLVPYLDNFGTMFTDTFNSIGKAWDEYGGEFIEQFDLFFENIRKTWKHFYNTFIKPIGELINELIENVWDKTLKPLVDTVIESAISIGNNLMCLYNEFLYPIFIAIYNKIYPKVLFVIHTIKDVFESVIHAIGGILKGLFKMLDGVIQFIVGVFTGNWKKAWGGVKKIFKGVWDSLVAIVKFPINLIIDLINALLRGITGAINKVVKMVNKLSFDVPDWVPGIGGEKFGFNLKTVTAAQIPKLATGGIVTSSTILNAGEAGAEAILPLENNTGWMDILADKLASRNSAPTRISLMLDGNELGHATIDSINNITRQTGKLQLAII